MLTERLLSFQVFIYRAYIKYMFVDISQNICYNLRLMLLVMPFNQKMDKKRPAMSVRMYVTDKFLHYSNSRTTSL